MNLLPLEILPLWATSLLALSLLGGGSYLIWGWAARFLVGPSSLVAGIVTLVGAR